MQNGFAESLNWIDRQVPRMVELLEGWGNINSGSYQTGGLAEQAAALKLLLAELPGSGEEIPLPAHVVISDRGEEQSRLLGHALMMRSPERRGPRVLLAIHYDTVFGAEHAFQRVTRVDGNTLRGPGVCDAKGGLVVLLFALQALERSDFGRSLNWEVLLNPDEELGSPGSGLLFQAAARRNDVGLLFEPALPDGALVSGRKGSGNFTFVVRGRSAHSGRNPEQGRNAINALAAIVGQLAALQSEIPGTVVNTGYIHGGGPVNIVPDLAMCRVNVRVETAAQQERLERRLHEIARSPQQEGIRVELHDRFLSPPKIVTPALDGLLRLVADCGKELGVPLAWRPTGGACDGNRLAAAGLPVVDSLGVRGGNIHTDQEFVLLDSLAERAKITALFLMRVAAGEIALDSVLQAREERAL